MASILDHQLMMGDETTYGTPVTPTKGYEYAAGDGMDYRPNRVQSESLRPGQVGPRKARRVTPNGDYGGTFNTEVLSRGYGWLFNKLMGGTPTNTVVSGSVYQVVHTLGGPLKPVTLQQGIPRIAADGTATVDPFTYTGVTFPAWGLTMDNTGVLQLRFDADARDLSTSTALATYSGPPATANLFTFAGASIYGGSYTAATTTALASGATALANVTNWNLDVSRDANVSRFLFGGGGKKAIPVPKLAAVTGTIGIEYTDTVYRDAYLADTDLVLVATFEAGTLTTGKETLQVIVPNMRLEGELPKPNGDVTTASCNFTALEDGTNPLLQIVQRTLDTTL